MWLLNAATRQLEYVIDDRQLKGQYAILSHSWDDEEVSFQEMHLKEAKAKSGYRKIEQACKQALDDGLRYCWVDTCCIDKRSSAELSESINSMYRWYRNASVCYAFLTDVTRPSEQEAGQADEYAVMLFKVLQSARWFTRGWTLQELIAPRDVRFFDSGWTYIGSKLDLLDILSSITRIEEAVLKDRSQLRQASIAKRMSWASGRETSRPEDEAYCLLGIFDVNLPLLYGEGQKAFFRLQEEIFRTRTWPDHSLLAHTHGGTEMLAASPKDFQHAHDVVSWPVQSRQLFDLTNAELRISAQVMETPLRKGWGWEPAIVVPLNCCDAGNRKMQYALKLRRQDIPEDNATEMDDEDKIYCRAGAPIFIHRVEFANAPKRVINVSRSGRTGFIQRADKILFSSGPPWPIPLSPDVEWDDESRSLTLVKEPLDPSVVQLGLRWSGSVMLHLPKALTGLHPDVELYIRTSTEPEFRDIRSPGLSIRLGSKPADNLANIDILSEELNFDLDSWISAGMNHDFLESSCLTLQRDGSDVLRIDAKHLTFDGETMWQLTITEVLGLFMVE